MNQIMQAISLGFYTLTGGFYSIKFMRIKWFILLIIIADTRYQFITNYYFF
jgi:hypothetical protein